MKMAVRAWRLSLLVLPGGVTVTEQALPYCHWRERQLEDHGSQPSFLKTTPGLAQWGERDRAGASALSWKRETVGGPW